MDNTLLHSDKAHAKAFNMALVKMGLKKVSYYKMAKHFGKPKEGVALAIVGRNKKLQEQFIDFHDYYLYKDTKKYTRKIRGVVSVLKKLRKKYDLALLSNCSHRNIQILTKAAKLDHKLFKVLVGNDDIKHPKPAPDEIRKAKKILHIKKEETYMVGDSIYDIKAGKRAKVKTIGVLTGLYSKETLLKEKPDLILKSVRDLPKYLL